MKKKLDTISEMVFPEIKEAKKLGYINYPCPDCEQNNRFKVLEITFKSKIVKGYTKSGRYRSKCTLCGYETTITSRNPMI